MCAGSARTPVWFTAGSAIAAAARGFVIAGLLTTPVLHVVPGIAARWFVIPLLLLPGVFAPLLAKRRRVRALVGGRNVTSLHVLASFFRAGLVCIIPWAQTPGVFVAEGVLFGATALAAGVLDTWLRWTWRPGSVPRSPWFAASLQLVFGAATLAIGVATARTTHGVLWFYGGASLYVLAGVIASFGGSVAPERKPV